jgi:hypothetical protein
MRNLEGLGMIKLKVKRIKNTSRYSDGMFCGIGER